MKILGVKVLLPAIVQYRNDSNNEDSVFCYFDPITGDVTIAEDMLLSTKNNLQKLIGEYVISKRVSHIVPPMPSEGFTKLNPETYTQEN